MTLVATIGLAVSAVTVIAALPHITEVAGIGRFAADTTTHLWTLGLLMLLAGPIRTFGWRAYVGTGLAGFLAISALARLVGQPVVHRLGSTSVVATAVWAPVTEEVLKALPVVLVVALVARRTVGRPSALDVCLLGAWCGAGFALYEDALSGRGGAAWSANVPFSLLVPSEMKTTVSGTSIVAGGHLVYTGLIALGLGFSVLYRRRFRRAWLAAPAAVAVVTCEHMAVNALPLLDAHGREPLIERILAPITIDGRLSSVLLVAGVIGVAVLERRAVGRSSPANWIAVRASEAGRRARRLAAAQLEMSRPLTGVIK